MPLLDSLNGPEDLRDLSDEQLDELAGEIRSRLIHAVAGTAATSAPTSAWWSSPIALHRVFESPRDRSSGTPATRPTSTRWSPDARHQFDRSARLAACPAIRGRPSPRTTGSRTPTPRRASPTPTGWPRPTRCAASTRRVVAVIGDGALTGGMAWEALNNIAAGHARLVIVVNDNGRSYSPTVGGLARPPLRAADPAGVRIYASWRP